MLACRLSDISHAYFQTATLAIADVDAIPPSKRRTPLGAGKRPSQEARQAYFGRMVRSTRTMAGMISSASDIS